jgi:hypothetical protein
MKEASWQRVNDIPWNLKLKLGREKKRLRKNCINGKTSRALRASMKA